MSPDELLDLARRQAVPLEPAEAALIAPALARSREVLAAMRRLPIETAALPGVPLPEPAAEPRPEPRD
jgi:hypothetical protein